MNTKDNSLNIWRIYFAYIIALYHLFNAYGIPSSLYIATDFFFILSGILLASEAYKNKYANAGIMLRSKLRKYYIHYIFSLIVSWCIFRLTGLGPEVRMTELIPEILLIQMVGFNLKIMVNVPTWYLSVFLMCSYFIYYLYKEHKSIYLNIIAPFSIMVVFTYFYRKYGFLSHISLGEDITESIYWNKPLFLGFSLMSLGVIGFEIFLKNKEMRIRGGASN